MKITVNGQEREVPEGTTVAALLASLSITRENAVVERNGEVLERSRYDRIPLAAADRLEIVRFVGGG